MTYYQRKKTFIVILSCIVYYTLAGFIILPFLLKTLMVAKLPDVLDRKVIVNKVKINPYTLTVTLEGLIVKDKNEEILISSDEVFINIQSSSILKRALVIKELHLNGPYFGMIRNADNSFNFSDLIKKEEEPQKEDEEKAEVSPPRFFLDGISIRDGNFNFRDKKINKAFTATDIELSVPFISSLPEYTDIDVLPYFSAYLDGDPVEFKAKTRPFNQIRQSYLEIDIDRLSLPDFFAYLPLAATVDMRSGDIDITLALTYSEEVKGTPTVSVDGNVTLSHLEAFDKKGDPLVKLPTLSIDIAPSTPLTKRIYLDMISIRSPEVYIQKNNKGQLNLLNLFPSDNETQDNQNNTPSETDKSTPFTFMVKQSELTDGKVIYSDQSLKIPFTSSIEPLNITLNQLTNEENQEAGFTVSARSDGDEKLELSGNLSLNPLAVKGAITVRDLPINRYKPFYNDFILFDIAHGIAYLKSEFLYDSTLSAPGVIIPDLAFSLNSLTLKSQQDKEEFLHIPALSLRSCSFDSIKHDIQVGQFSTEKASFLVKKDEKGQINVLNLVPPPSEKKQESHKQTDKHPEHLLDKKNPDQQSLDSSTPWHIKVNEALINEYKLKVEDRQSPEMIRFTVDEMSLGANDFILETSSPKPLIDIAHLSLSLKTLTLHSQKSNEDIMNIGNISLNKCSFNYQKQALTIGEFATEKGSFFIKRSKQGVFSFQNLAFSSPEPKTKEKDQIPAEKKSHKKKTENQNPDSPLPWHIKVNKISLKEYSLKTEDLLSPATPLATIDDINLVANDFTFESAKKDPLISLPNLSLSLNKLNIHSQKSDEDIISIANISFNECSYDSQKQALRIKEFATEKGSFVLKKSQDGVFNIQNLAGPSTVGQKVSDELTPLRDEEKKQPPVQKKPVKKVTKAQKPFHVQIDKTSLKGYTISAEDQQSSELTLFTVNDINFDAREFTFESSPKQPLMDLPQLSLSLNSLALRSQKSNEDVISIGNISLNESSFSLQKKALTIGEFSTEKGSLLLRRTEQGELNVQNLFAASSEESVQASTEPPPKKQSEAKKSQENSPPWRVKVNKASLKEYTVKAEDLQSPALTLFTIDDISFNADKFTFESNPKQPQIDLNHLSLSLNALKLHSQKSKEDFIRIPQLSLNNCSFDSTQQEIKIGHVKTEKGFVLVRNAPEGELNFQNLSPTAPEKEVKPTKTKPQKIKKEQPWRVKVDKASLKGYTVKAEDLQRQNGAYFTFDRVNFEAQNFSTEKNKKTHTSLSLRFNDKGNVNLKGLVALDPLALNLQINISDIFIPSFQPYYMDSIKLIVKNGNFQTTGNLSFSFDRESKPKINYSGNISITDFASVDPIKTQDFLKWSSLKVNDIVFGYIPFSLIIEDIALNDFYSLFIINSDKTTNFKNIIAKEEKQADKQKTNAEEEKQEKGPAPDIFIKKIALESGKISFTDNLISPSFTSELIDLYGSITGLSSRSTTAANVAVTGQLRDHAPLEITGTINPLTKDLSADIRMSFKGIGLSPFTPYSGKYLGYTVQKGKLTLNLNYKISKNKLKAKNRLLLDQLTLGDKVDSPQAVNLPLKLAIALLKDRNGVIDLDVPIKGDLKDPKFSIGSVILHVFKNIITRAVTSPYSFIKGAAGSGEELHFIEFDYGSTKLNNEAIKKLDIIANALYNRPSLKLEIAGSVDKEKDFHGLKEKRFEDLLKTEKARDMVEKGQEVPPFDEITINSDEYDTYLTKAYKEADFPKEKTSLGLLKNIPPQQMEKLLNDHIEVTDNDVKLLAQKRATVVKDYILGTGKVKSKRLFIVLTPPSTKKIVKDVKKSHVLFTLVP